jgi:transposase
MRGERSLLGRRRGQVSIADVDGWYKKIPHNSFWRRIHDWSGTTLSDDQFADWYAPTGRPSIPPSYMLTLILIQLRFGWSDREVVENAYFDDRVKFALGVSRMPEITCEHSTVCRYRARFLAAGMGRQILRETLQAAAERGLLGDEEDLVDSFPIAGAAARQGTHVLIYRAIGRVLAEAAEAKVEVPALGRSDYGRRRKPQIAWRNDTARQALLEELVEDGRLLCARLGAVDLPESLGQAVEILHMVVEQDIETDDKGRVTIARKTAPDRVISVSDPDMRHGRKTSSQKYDGYKGHLLTANTTADQPRLITAAAATAANVADGAVLAELLKQRAELTGSMPHKVMGDTAYGGVETRERVARVAPDTRVEAPVPPAVAAGGRYAKTDFTIDLEAHTVTCPAENTIVYTPKKMILGHKDTQSVRFPAKMCEACPLRAGCVGAKRGGRTITIRADEAEIRVLRARQADPAWQAHYCERSRVEHVNQCVCHHGGRRARGCGQAKVDWQLAMVAALHNIEELARVLGSAWWPPRLLRPQCLQTAG